MSKRKLHQWKKLDIKYEDLGYSDDKSHRTNKCYECIKCGLRKGYTQSFDRYGDTVYYEDGQILSKGVLPFECVSYERLKTEKADGRNAFLTKEDFYV